MYNMKSKINFNNQMARHLKLVLLLSLVSLKNNFKFQAKLEDNPLCLKYNSPYLLCPLILDDNKDYRE